MNLGVAGQSEGLQIINRKVFGALLGFLFTGDLIILSDVDSRPSDVARCTSKGVSALYSRAETVSCFQLQFVSVYNQARLLPDVRYLGTTM